MVTFMRGAHLREDDLGKRILAEGSTVSNDTRQTHMNNNDLIVGTTGSGKTRNYVKPNLLQMDESVIVTDTKGSLVREVGPVLARHGYEVVHLDLTNPGASAARGWGYNPLDYIHRDKVTNRINEQDVMSITCALCPIESQKDPFWDECARIYISMLIGLALETSVASSCTLATITKLIGAKDLDEAISNLERKHPSSFAARRYHLYQLVAPAQKTDASVKITVASKLDQFVTEGLQRMYTAPRRIDFRDLGLRRMALFLTVSDTDHAMDALVTLLYAQALHGLCDYADDCCRGSALPVPVRLYLDDFATNCCIPDFDKIISVIRSRNIAVSVVLQSLTQLETLYGRAQADTIVNGCDHVIYLGGRDLQSARYVAEVANRTVSTVLALPRDQEYLLETGQPARLLPKYHLEEHPLYWELGEDSRDGDWTHRLDRA